MTMCSSTDWLLVINYLLPLQSSQACLEESKLAMWPPNLTVFFNLGVAFEQGKILPTPETVPFRLTRDIVDGMGITGVEGVFRR